MLDKKQYKVLLSNGIAILAFGLILCVCYLRFGYANTFNMLRCDYRNAVNSRELGPYERGVARLGMGYVLYQYVKENTPDDAVIYIPGEDAFTSDGYAYKFSSIHHANKLWAVRFLYPRKVVTEQEYVIQGAIPPLTHVLVINGHGAEILPYKVVDTVPFQVYPMQIDERK